MKHLLNKGVAYFTYSLLIFTSLDITANRGEEIAILSDKNNDGFIDSSSSMKMDLINKKGDVVSRKLRFRRLEVPDDGDKSLSLIHI